MMSLDSRSATCMHRGAGARSVRTVRHTINPSETDGQVWPLEVAAVHGRYPVVTGLQRHHISRHSSPSPDSISDLVFDLQQQQAVNYQIGETSSRDLHNGTSGSATSATTTPTSNRHGCRKLLRSYHTWSANCQNIQAMDQMQDVPRPIQMEPVPGGAQPNVPADRINQKIKSNPQNIILEFAPIHGRPILPGLHIQSPPDSMPLPPPTHGIKVVRLTTVVDKRWTVVDERSPEILKFNTPLFRAKATVEIPPLLTGQHVEVGWIHVCRDMQFVNVYGREGITSWEFPEIVSGKCKDGMWYGSNTGKKTIEGPTLQPTLATVHTNNSGSATVTRYIPLSDYSDEPALEFIYRKQRFYAFLVLRDLTANTYQIMKTIAWMVEMAIKVNPHSYWPFAEQSRVLGPVEQEHPCVLDDVSGIQLENALSPPNANSSQVLVWRPQTGEPQVIVPPVQTTVDMNRYLSATNDQYAKLRQLLQNTTYITT